MKNEILNERNFVTTKEFCEIFDNMISVTTVNVMIRKGEIPSVGLGHRNLIPVAYVRKLLQKRAGCREIQIMSLHRRQESEPTLYTPCVVIADITFNHVNLFQ